MQGMQVYLEKLLRDVAECRLMSDLCIDTEKRKLFSRLADHNAVLASEIEREIEKQDAGLV